MLQNNTLALFVTFCLSVLWLRCLRYSVARGWISTGISRKIIHIGTGPLFVLCWILFDSAAAARYMAVIVPVFSTGQFALTGLGIIKDRTTVESMSRSGDMRELLRGPLLYGLMFILITIIFWKTTLAGIVALMILCGGDGLADIFGKRFGRRTLPWSKEKTWVGSLAMLAGSVIMGLLMIIAFDLAGLFNIEYRQFILKLLVVSLASTIIESISRSDIDNITVPATAATAGLLLQL